MKNFTSVFLAVFTLFSCNQVVNHKEDNSESVTTISEKKVENKEKDTSEFSKNSIDTIVFKDQTAIIIEPTDRRIEERIREIGEEDFYTGADDYMWYLSESYETFRKNNLPVLKIKTDKIIKFVMENGNYAIVDLTRDDELWQVYLFNPRLKPKKISMTDSENEFKTYFK
ncbi:hypothetical protein [Flavobacterium sp.]|uniref:hypothetical protein n=1 Tax=Flavobacterium sp. TaxID=239 RepID=UPI00262D6F0F|nr:hypothetical protein [Flavobacterium sp.]